MDSNTINPYLTPPPSPREDDSSAALLKPEKSFLLTAKKVGLAILALFDIILDTFIKQPASDFLGLATLRHGTSFNRFVNIQVEGLDPNTKKGQGICEGLAIQAQWSKDKDLIMKKVEYYKEHSKAGSFFLMDMSHVGISLDHDCVDTFKREDVEGIPDLKMGVAVSRRKIPLFQGIKDQLFIRAAPRYYAWLTGLAEGGTSTETGIIPTTKKIASGLFNMLLCPTLKVRLRPEQINSNHNNFEDDDLMLGLAIQSSEWISPSHFGFEALFAHGCQGDIGARMKNNPKKAAWGLVRLINPLGLCFLGVLGGYLAYQKISGAFNRPAKLIRSQI